MIPIFRVFSRGNVRGMKSGWGVGVVEKENGPKGARSRHSVLLSAEPYVVEVSIACLRCFTEARA
jgi:hypothetical protein